MAARDQWKYEGRRQEDVAAEVDVCDGLTCTVGVSRPRGDAVLTLQDVTTVESWEKGLGICSVAYNCR